MDWSLLAKIPYEQWPVFILIVMALGDKLSKVKAAKDWTPEINEIKSEIRDSETRRQEEHATNGRGIMRINKCTGEISNKMDRVMWEQDRQGKEIDEIKKDVKQNKKEMDNKMELHITSINRHLQKEAS